jgi:hypothetical protein
MVILLVGGRAQAACSVFARNPRMAVAISSACVSSAKWPVSKKRTSAFGDVAPERLGAGRQEERVVAAPDRQQRRLVLAEIRLERRVQRHVARVVQEQVELDVVRAGRDR